MILDGSRETVELPGIHTAVYSFSYESREREDMPYLARRAGNLQENEIVMVHGGDAKHVPLQKEELASYGYGYAALGHIHKPQILIPDAMAYSGALEPIDKNDTGAHGYIFGEMEKNECRIRFVPFAKREYIHADVLTEAHMSGYDVKERIKETIEKQGEKNIYKITLRGFRSPDTLFDLDALDPYGNVIEIADDTKPSYDFAKIKENNRDNILGNLIEALEGYGEDSVEYRAMCEGVQAFMETRRG